MGHIYVGLLSSLFYFLSVFAVIHDLSDFCNFLNLVFKVVPVKSFIRD